MKRKTEPPQYISPNNEKLSEEKQRKRIRTRVHTKSIIEKEPAKVSVNLNRCSLNWKTIVAVLPPKVIFKLQQLKESKLRIKQENSQTFEVSNDKKI